MSTIPLKLKNKKIIAFKVDMFLKPLQNTQHICRDERNFLIMDDCKNLQILGVSPSGKAQGFDPCIPRFES